MSVGSAASPRSNTPLVRILLTCFDAEAVVFCVFIASKITERYCEAVLGTEHTLCITICCHWMLRPSSTDCIHFVLRMPNENAASGGRSRLLAIRVIGSHARLKRPLPVKRLLRRPCNCRPAIGEKVVGSPLHKTNVFQIRPSGDPALPEA